MHAWSMRRPKASRARFGALSLVLALLGLPFLAGCAGGCTGTHVINHLAGVFALSADDGWAVGGTSTSSSTLAGLIEHWDGSQWTVVPSPALSFWGAGYTSSPPPLTAVGGSGPADVWAVGRNANNTTGPVVEHWNGRVWQASSAPCSSQCTSSQLNAVVALSPSDAWAVGEASIPVAKGYPYRPLVEHWNGTQWALVAGGDGLSGDTVPGYAASNAGVLDSVVAYSDTDVWVVGVDMSYYPLIAHWNGTGWQVIANASGANGALRLPLLEFNSRLSAASAPASASSSQRTIWMAGATSPCGQCDGEAPLVLVGSGTHWETSLSGQLPPAATGAKSPEVKLQAAAALSSSDVWVVGTYQGPPATSWPPSRGFTAHWDGEHWQTLPTAQRQTSDGLESVSAVSSNDVWAVGQSLTVSTPDSGAYGTHTLTEHWDGAQWTVVPSPDPGAPVPDICM